MGTGRDVHPPTTRGRVRVPRWGEWEYSETKRKNESGLELVVTERPRIQVYPRRHKGSHNQFQRLLRLGVPFTLYTALSALTSTTELLRVSEGQDPVF